MTTKLGLASLALALLAACGLYLLKDQVQRQERELQRVQSAVAAERSALTRLRAEWALLNQPGRIARLARAHLALQPAEPNQIVAIEAIPLRTDLELGKLRLTALLPSGGVVALRLKPPWLMSLPALADHQQTWRAAR
jgi:cell division protein FtsL